MQNIIKNILGTTLIAGLAGAVLLADEAKIDLSKIPPPVKKQGVTYAKDIRPIVEKTCVKCHGPEKQKGRLRLDSLEWILKGARGEPILVKGNSAKSKIIHAISRLDPDEAMPPEGKGDPLTKEQIGLFRAWIDQGAK
ncbi:MAG: hypothetical protein D6766_10420 [Verrucomicrobia bacterium]|nr:MAG: hypothetical protein D6766_10420 [Verrucomicrobiota bacterium]